MAQLFRVGTGWLGWPPAVVLDAPLPHLIEAQRGRVEMLNGIFGGGSKDKPATQARPASRRDRPPSLAIHRAKPADIAAFMRARKKA